MLKSQGCFLMGGGGGRRRPEGHGEFKAPGEKLIALCVLGSSFPGLPPAALSVQGDSFDSLSRDAELSSLHFRSIETVGWRRSSLRDEQSDSSGPAWGPSWSPSTPVSKPGGSRPGGSRPGGMSSHWEAGTSVRSSWMDDRTRQASQIKPVFLLNFRQQPFLCISRPLPKGIFCSPLPPGPW